MWRLVRDLYYHDRVEEAYREAEQRGFQDINNIFAEAEARRAGAQHKVRPWLTVEAIPDQIGDSLPGVIDIVVRECEDLSARFGWDHREATFVAFLPAEAEQPWMPGRWGYFVDKIPYDKICLPWHLVKDYRELSRTVRHEFMHGITLNLGNGHAPSWLSEGLSTLVEGGYVNSSARGWRSGKLEWMTAGELNRVTSLDDREAAHLSPRIAAYDQANAVVSFLANEGGDRRLENLLRTIGDDSWRHGLEERILGRSRTDLALREVYGVSESEAFDQAHSWVMSR